MIGPSEEAPLNALRAASGDGDAESVARIWRELTPGEQENVLLALLEIQTQTSAAESTPTTVEPLDPPVRDSRDTAMMARVEQTELIPKGIEDLRGLTVSEVSDEAAFAAEPALQNKLAAYRSRWVRRWKLSAVVAAWAVTTLFAFTADTSSFGPSEWVVALLGTVLGGGVLVGTLVNFAVAALPELSPGRN